MTFPTARDLQTAIKDHYTTITLPNGLGSPTGKTREPDGGFTPPLVVVKAGRTITISRTSARTYRVTREFVARLYTAAFESDTPSAIETRLNNALDCVEAVEDAFMFLGNTLKQTGGVLDSVILADTGDATLIDRNNDTYAGILFRHQITYNRGKSAS